MNTLNLTNYNLVRPEKIRWRFNYSGGEPADYIKSKSLRKFLRKIDDILAQQKITRQYLKLSPDLYHTWLEFYIEKSNEKGFDILATPDWYHTKMAAHKEIWGIMYYQKSVLIGGSILTKDTNGMVVHAFKASEQIELTNDANSSFGAILDYDFLRTMVEENATIISSGRSRNAFGVINSLGYLDYKLRFGYSPDADPLSPILTKVSLNTDGIVLSFCYDNDSQLGLYAFVPKGTTQKFEHERFANEHMPFIYLEY